MTREASQTAYPVTVVGTKYEGIHIFEGHLSREQAIEKVYEEGDFYPDDTVFIVAHKELDLTQDARKNAEKLLADMAALKKIVSDSKPISSKSYRKTDP